MRKKMFKKSTLSKAVRTIARKFSPKKEEMSKAEQNFVKNIFKETYNYGKIGNLSGSSSYSTLEDGDIDIDVIGTIDSRTLMGKIYRKYHTNKIKLTLTPIDDYQVKMKWPEPPFVNVNLFRSKKTTKDNWIGYVDTDGPDKIPLDEIVSKNGNVNVWASAHRKQGDYCVTLHLSSKYKIDEDKTVSSYVSHDDAQIKYLTMLSCDTWKDYIPVSISKDQNSKCYNFSHNKMIVGSASIKKIDSCLNGREIHKSFMRITKFRFDDDDDNKHYSQIIIQLK